MDYQLFHGDCLDVLPTLPDSSVDAIITDPPYPYIKREYGYWTEETWLPMMQEVVRQSRRILKPSGSMVIILQPNSEKVGSMRLWLWRFMVWCGEYWNIVQDAYWWNITALPVGGAITAGLLRNSLKSCLWLGDTNCYRQQDKVLWGETERTRQDRAAARVGREITPSGHRVRRQSIYQSFAKRGGVTPYNVLPIPNNDSVSSAGSNGHGAGTPLELCDWWTRYICPPGGVVGDWFAGTATTGIAALQNGCSYIGIERFEKYIPAARERLEKAKPAQMRLEAA